MVNNIKDLFKDLGFILKFTVFIILIVATIFAAPNAGYRVINFLGDQGTYQLVECGVYIFIIVIGAILVLYIFDSPHDLYNMCYLIVGGLFNIVAGIMLLIAHANGTYNDDGKLRVMLTGVLCLAAGIIMFVDLIINQIVNKKG